MVSTTSISVQSLSGLIGTPDCPRIVDICIDEDFAAMPKLIPTAIRRDFRAVDHWAAEFGAGPVAIVCQKGLKLSQGAAALLRHRGVAAVSLEGGMLAWDAAGAPLLTAAALPARKPDGATLWVTRERPKIDRIACPWLIRRFIDRDAVFLFVEPDQVALVADRFQAIPFDIDGVASHCLIRTVP